MQENDNQKIKQNLKAIQSNITLNNFILII